MSNSKYYMHDQNIAPEIKSGTEFFDNTTPPNLFALVKKDQNG